MELSSAITASTERTDGAEAILVDFSDGLEALMAVPVWFLSTWGVAIVKVSSQSFGPRYKINRKEKKIDLIGGMTLYTSMLRNN